MGLRAAFEARQKITNEDLGNGADRSIRWHIGIWCHLIAAQGLERLTEIERVDDEHDDIAFERSARTQERKLITRCPTPGRRVKDFNLLMDYDGNPALHDAGEYFGLIDTGCSVGYRVAEEEYAIGAFSLMRKNIVRPHAEGVDVDRHVEAPDVLRGDCDVTRIGIPLIQYRRS